MAMNNFSFNVDVAVGDFRVSGGFTLKSGEILALYAKSGAGKSTIIKSILNIHKNTSKSMINNDLLEPSDIGFVLQNNSLFENFNVYENVVFSTTKSILEDIKLKFKKHQNHDYFMKILEKTGLKGFENKDIKSLSGGQKQRLGIACALANKPKLLIFDESFNALDKDIKQEIFDLILSLKKELNFAVIFVSHSEFDVVYLADFVVGINDGKITPKQSIDEFINLLEKTFSKDDEKFLALGDRVFKV